MREETIKNAFIMGKLDCHKIKKEDGNALEIQKNQGERMGGQARLVVWGEKPKRKTFEQILREAEMRVHQQAEDEVNDIKETLSKGKINVCANRIAKSITHQVRGGATVEGGNEQWGGVVTGICMMKNPFIKVVKKKKKKKKKV